MEMERKMEAEKTPAPTPGVPLSAESVKLLKAGDVLRVAKGPLIGEPSIRIPQGALVVFEKTEQGLIGVSGDFWGHQAFSFIGRPDAEGWMTWSGGENPVPGQMVDWMNSIGQTGEGVLSNEVNGLGYPTMRGSYPITAFRLTTPSDQGEEDAFDGLEEQIAAIEASPEYETESVAAEAYQVIGAIASAGGLFDHPDVQRALDYFGGDREGEILPFAVSTTPASGSDGLETVARRIMWIEGDDWDFACAADDPLTEAEEAKVRRRAFAFDNLVTREAAERRIARLVEVLIETRETLIQSDLKIRSFAYADQSDVEFIRSSISRIDQALALKEGR